MSKEKKNNSETKKKVKKVVGGLLAAVLLVGGAILGTLAFLKTMSDTKTNTFTASQDIKLGLDEPNYNEKVEDTTDRDNDDDTEELVLKNPDEPDPSNYIPEQEYLKDPTLYNLTGGDTKDEEWVAMRVDYTIGEKEGNNDNTVTYSQLTHSCDDYGDKVVEYDVIDANMLANACYQWNDAEKNTKKLICSKKNIKGGTGIIDPITFDADEYDDKESEWNSDTKKSWIRLTSDQIEALLTEDQKEALTDGEDNVQIKYDIFVYKYTLKEKSGVKELATAQKTNDGLSEAKVTTSTNDGGSTIYTHNNGGKTTPLFESITTQTSDKLKVNGYYQDGSLQAPQFEIKLKGAAAKNDNTVSIAIIDPEKIDETIKKYEEYNALDDSGKENVDPVTETDSYKIVKELVQLLASAS